MDTPATTLLGTPPNGMLDEIAQHLRVFLEAILGASVGAGTSYEVEAKFGVFVDRNTNQRISLPVLSSCVLAPGDWYRFESDLSVGQHRRFNELFNAQAARWKYQHHRTVDTFYVAGPERRRIRVSRDARDRTLISAVAKRRVADLALHVPAAACDVRLSVNTEDVVAFDERTAETLHADGERCKDRISYQFDRVLQIDLTQVRQQVAPSAAAPPQLKHELEVEVLDAQRQLSTDPHFLPTLLANILDIARHAP